MKSKNQQEDITIAKGKCAGKREGKMIQLHTEWGNGWGKRKKKNSPRLDSTPCRGGEYSDPTMTGGRKGREGDRKEGG